MGRYAVQFLCVFWKWFLKPPIIFVSVCNSPKRFHEILVGSSIWKFALLFSLFFTHVYITSTKSLIYWYVKKHVKWTLWKTSTDGHFIAVSRSSVSFSSQRIDVSRQKTFFASFHFSRIYKCAHLIVTTGRGKWFCSVWWFLRDYVWWYC